MGIGGRALCRNIIASMRVGNHENVAWWEEQTSRTEVCETGRPQEWEERSQRPAMESLGATKPLKTITYMVVKMQSDDGYWTGRGTAMRREAVCRARGGGSSGRLSRDLDTVIFCCPWYRLPTSTLHSSRFTTDASLIHFEDRRNGDHRVGAPTVGNSFPQNVFCTLQMIST